jgi:hypothetical protein
VIVAETVIKALSSVNNLANAIPFKLTPLSPLAKTPLAIKKNLFVKQKNQKIYLFF